MTGRATSDPDQDPVAGGARGPERADDPPLVAVTDVPDRRPIGGRTIDLLLVDFANVIGCEVALIAELDGRHGARLTAFCGLDGLVAITFPRRGGRRRPGSRPDRGTGFVGRALTHRRPAFEALDPELDADLIDGASTAVTHALAVPVEALHAAGSGVLVAGFGTAVDDLERAFWIADSYAGMVAVLGHHPDALTGLMDHARLDGLTGCLTYRSVLDELARELSRAARWGLPLSCCFIDLDAFKHVNDRHGHLYGNEVLANVGQTLRSAVRGSDTVGRYGGDEFIAILPQTAETKATRLAQRLQAAIAKGHAERFEGSLTASIGVADWAAGLTSEELLARADSALFAAKGQPGSVVTYREASMIVRDRPTLTI